MTTSTGTSTTYFVGTHYEVTDGLVTKYYYAGTQRIAMRKNGVLNFIIGDHPSTALRASLGSISVIVDASGNIVSQWQYKARQLWLILRGLIRKPSMRGIPPAAEIDTCPGRPAQARFESSPAPGSPRQ